MLAVGVTILPWSTAQAGELKTFESGSLIIPMDLSYQDHGLFQAYGLVFQLLNHGVKVHWVIDPNKTWCDPALEACAWDCADMGSGPCAYPTASPDFFAATQALFDKDGAIDPPTAITSHGYRGGPFVIEAADKTAALAIIEVWNDPSQWDANPWAKRTVSQVVTVHEATASFEGFSQKTLVTAPSIAVFADGNEDIAAGYLRAAGIPQSNGTEFPAASCNGNCGPGTANPDLLTVESIMGDMGTCEAPNMDHKNGALFTADGNPAYCQIMSMHWGIKDRETVKCDGGACPATQAECNGETFTYHGHEVVAEVREFLSFPTHFFAECQAVNAYENTIPNPNWPYLDDEGRMGHFLTTIAPGVGNACDGANPCASGLSCKADACGPGNDCCQFDITGKNTEWGAGFLVAPQPDSADIRVLNPEVPYNQIDGAFGTVGGSEPAYRLATNPDSTYKNDLEITFLTGTANPGEQDVWMTGYMDGECDLRDYVEFAPPPMCNLGKVSYLGGHSYKADTPVTSGSDSQGTRLFLNALFEADCVSDTGQPLIAVNTQGPTRVAAMSAPAEATYTLAFANQGPTGALDAEVVFTAPAGVTITAASGSGVIAGQTATFALGTLAGMGRPMDSGSREVTLSFADFGAYELNAEVRYRVGASAKTKAAATLAVTVAQDSDGDGVDDDNDPEPNDPNKCGDSDSDGCDDCAGGNGFDPANDGCTPPMTGDGGTGGTGGDGGSSAEGGCGCRIASTGTSPHPAAFFVALGLIAWRTRRRRR